MELSKMKRLSLYSSLKDCLSAFSLTDIEDGIMFYCLTDYGYDAFPYSSATAKEIASKLKQSQLPTDLETITEFFGSLLDDNNIDENGIVFTPKYIAEHIISSVASAWSSEKSSPLVIDPACGCGIFLVAAAELLLSITNKHIDSIIQDSIFGIDIVEDNVRRCKLIMQLLSAKHGGDYGSIHPNIICADSLKTDWASAFGVEAFDYVVGNPPYVNPHDLNKDTVKYLKETFITTQSGVFNIFYAFIEKGIRQLKAEGVLSFIVPNNFFTIKSAQALREFLRVNALINRIIDFGGNMVFKPVRTYNCIIQLSKTNKLSFEYCVLPNTDDVESALTNVVFNSMGVGSLDKNGWKLVDDKTYRNLRRIESQLIQIKAFIRTGIATLRDKVYFVEKDDVGFYKNVEGNKIYVESGLVKSIYKVSELEQHHCIDDARRHIIFPYTKTKAGYSLIAEDVFSKVYPQTYACLSLYRNELDTRDKSKGVAQGWYAYGRTQGLNKYGKKLLFPTFASSPKFIYVDDEDALFCNGYAVFENDRYDLVILEKILNSRLMDYYISNTSYSIEGGYYCYQKKYVERFSLPWLSDDEMIWIRNASKKDLDDYLWALYGLE